MTLIAIDLERDAPTAPADTPGRLEFVAGGPRGDADSLVVPTVLRFDLLGAGRQLVSVPPTDTSFCYTAIVTVGTRVYELRYVTVPASGTVEWADLIDVDPATFVPAPPSVPSAQEVLAAATDALAHMPIGLPGNTPIPDGVPSGIIVVRY